MKKYILLYPEMRTWRYLLKREGWKGIVEIRSFPDGETYVRIVSDVKIKSIPSLYPRSAGH
jgi:ribose-phosphate pyrophosphokinase